MGPKLSMGLYIPNLDFAWKYGTTGNVGLPDGWTASAQAIADLITPTRVHWVPAMIGGGITSAGAYYDGSGRNLRIVAPSTLANNANRYLISPPGPYAQLPGSEPSSATFFAGESVKWWARIRVMFKGATAPTTDWSIQLRQLDTYETSDVLCGSLTIAAASWDGTWKYLESAPIAIDLSISALDHIRLRLMTASGPGAGSSIAQFDHITVETLGPVDFAEQTTGEGMTLAGADHETFYEFQKAPQHEGSVFGEPTTFAKVTTLPSGHSVAWDPSGGEVRRRFRLPYRFLRNDDAERIGRLWYGNKGRGGSAGLISYGVARPLVLKCTAPYYQRSVYVNFEGEQFPLDIDNTYQAALGSGALWRGTLPFIEV